MPFAASSASSLASADSSIAANNNQNHQNGGGGGLSSSFLRRNNHQKGAAIAPAVQRPLKAKVVVLGNTGVGKTSILLRHDGQGFTSKMSSTLGASYICSRSKMQNGREFELQIWDTAGQERFRSMVPLYLRNTAAAIVVFDISNRQSFRDLDSWLKEVERNDESGKILLFLVGNKCDLGEQRAISKEEGRQFADQQNAHYFETSALSGKGIETAMQTIAEDILQAEQRELKMSHSSFNLVPSEVGDPPTMEEEDGGGSRNGLRRKFGGGRKKMDGNGGGCCTIL